MSLDIPNLQALQQLQDDASSTLRRDDTFRVPNHLRTPFLLSVLAAAINGFLVSIMYMPLQPEIPIFYSLAQSSDHLAPKVMFFLLPILSFGVLAFHFFLLKFLDEIAMVMQRFFAWSTCIIEVLLLLASVRIIWLVT